MGKLLILGAGGHGQVVGEVALAMNCFEKIDFLDDNNPQAVGKINDFENFTSAYEFAFVGIGNNKFRLELLEKLKKCGYKIPVLIHPSAYISPSAVILSGTIVEPMAIVNTNARVDEGCIISVGAIVDHDAQIDKCAHINAGAICKGGSKISLCRKLEGGEVVHGYN